MTARLPAMEEHGWGRPLQPGAICLEPQELSQAAASLVPGEDPERAWIRYLRALALLALRRWLKHRGAALVLGPELEPEAPDRLLAIQGLATQLLCASPLADQVTVPLAPWRDPARAPQLLLLAQVDEENGVVEFPGVLAAAAIAAEIDRLAGLDQVGVDLPLEKFAGGLERLLRWVTLLEPEALAHADCSGKHKDDANLKTRLEKWMKLFLIDKPTLAILPVYGASRSKILNSEAQIRLITPSVQLLSSGEALAKTTSKCPIIWADTELAEIIIENKGQAVWLKRASSKAAITGPLLWPLDPIHPTDCYRIKLRPYGYAVGSYAIFSLTIDSVGPTPPSELSLLDILESS